MEKQTLKRIKYVSRGAMPLSAEEVEELRAVSQRNNRREGITGVLVETGGLFFQVIEGPESSVDHLYRKISADPRHSELFLLNVMTNVESRLFPEWAMKTVQLDRTDPRREAVRVLLETAVESHRRVQRLAQAIERVVWNEVTFSNEQNEDSDQYDQ